MRENKRIRQTQLLRTGRMLGLFIVISFLIRLPLVLLNEAEYTDGVLQLTQFAEQTGIYPPLYTIVCWPLTLIMPPMWAGRLMSTIFSALSVVPIYLLARRCFGARAAMFAALIFVVAPTSLRWSPRVMTESTFCFFFWFACERLIAGQGARTQKEADGALIWASLLGALAALTRYQGVFLGAPVLLIAFMHWKRFQFIPWKGLLALAFYGAVPAWSAVTNTIHGTQFWERTGDNVFMTFVLNAEPFLLYMPFFMTYPVALLVMLGLNKGRAKPGFAMLPLTLYVLGGLLVLQSLFGAFQERYFLPLFGLFYVWGGLGMAIADHRFRRRATWLRPYLPITVITWSLLFSFFVLWGGRHVWGDFMRASRYAAEVQDEIGGRIFTNEIYRDSRPERRMEVEVAGMFTRRIVMPAESAIVANKAEFFSNKNVHFLSEEYYTRKLPLRVNDLLIMSSAYSGEMQEQVLRELYELEPLASFDAVIIPVFPDLISVPIQMSPPYGGANQSPVAWLYRYTPQRFHTNVWRVTAVRSR